MKLVDQLNRKEIIEVRKQKAFKHLPERLFHL